jgi:large subunit ribosomal protein L19
MTTIEKEKNFIEKSQKNKFSQNLIQLVESKYLRNDLFEEKKEIGKKKDKKGGVNVGDIVQIGYKIPEGDKERIQFYEGVIISKKNRTLGKTFTIRRYVQSIGLEQIFLLHSPKISSLFIKQSSKIRKAKLYFIRTLSAKSTRLKLS